MPAKVTDLDTLRTRAQAAQALGISTSTWDRMVRRREIETVRIGSGRGRVYVTQRALDDYLAAATRKRA